MADVQGHIGMGEVAKSLGMKDKVDRKIKLVFLGAGSGFLESLVFDCMRIPGMNEVELVLVDIDTERLELAHQLCNKIVEAKGLRWSVAATTNRREVLPGADYVINCIEVSGTACVRHDYEIPKKYGVDQCIGDTCGPGGIMKGLRTVPVFLEVLKDMEELCPEAPVFNYTNPMSILCLAAHEASPVKVYGFCHGIQHTSSTLARYAGVPYEDMTWQCAGVNHIAWFTELRHAGRDLYPLLKQKIEEDQDLYEADPVRFDMMKHFGYFMTESSGHFSEYLPYYRKRDDLREKYCRPGYKGGSGFYAENWPTWRQEGDQNRREIIAGEKGFTNRKGKDLTLRTNEYASYVIEAMETNRPFVAYLTVSNESGLISNLPRDNVAEVACLVNRNGIQPTEFGTLPHQCAAVCDWNSRSYKLAAIACLERDREAAIHAMMVDPLTAAVCSPSEIRSMAEELFDAEKSFLPEGF